MRLVPGWLAEAARPARGPVPWAGMGLGALAVGVPLVAGLAAGHPVMAVLTALGGLIGSLADRIGPYPVRTRRVASAGIFGAAGLLIGAAVRGHGWLAVAVMIAVAGVSALLSSIGATWSTAGMFLLTYAALGTGPIGALPPMWLTPLWILAGIGWTLVLMLPGRLLRPRAVEQDRVAAVYRALAANLRAPGTEGFSATRQDVATALNVGYEELIGQRAAARGRDPRLARLVALLNQARLIADAAAALTYAGEQAPPQAAAQADAIAEAVLRGGTAVPRITQPAVASPGMSALYDALNCAAHVISDGKGLPAATPSAIWPSERRGPLRRMAEQVSQEFAATFAIRLMLCIGVATVCSETLALQRSYWVPLAVAVIMKPDFGSVFARTLQYGAGTVIGAAVGGLILVGDPPDPVLAAAVVIFAALLSYGMSRNYGLFGTFFTPLVILLLELLTHGGWRLAEARLIDILLGCVIVLCVGYVPWPSSWHAHVPRDLAAAIDEAAGYLDLALGDRAPGTAVIAHARARRKLGTVRVEFQRTLAEPHRVRERITVWWPTVIALEWLLEAISATAVNTAGQRPEAAAVSELSTALRQVASGVRAGWPVRPQPQPPRRPSLEVVSDAVHSVQEAVTGTPLQSTQPPSRRRAVTPDSSLEGVRTMVSLGRTALDVFPICLGGNVFGWTADEPASRAVLDAYTDAGGNFIDTANSYLVEHGRSETIIGRWLADRGNRDQIVVATKVGGGRGQVRNLRPETVKREAHASLERLQTDRIDLYFAHYDDPATPLEESLRAFDSLVKAGTVRHIGASNYTPERLTAALKLQRELGLAEFTVIQPHYNLLERDFEHSMLPVADAWDLAVLPYYALASGFLTGKYRPGGGTVESPRAEAARGYLDKGGAAVLEVLDQAAAAHQTTVAAVALAWLLTRPRVVAPIASARTPQQLEQILPAATLELTPAEADRLSATTQ